MTNQDIYQNSFIYTLYRVTPALRYIFLDIQRIPKNKIQLIAYFEKNTTDLEKEMVEDIADDIIGMLDEIFEREIKIVVTRDEYKVLNKTDYLLFARFENGVAY